MRKVEPTGVNKSKLSKGVIKIAFAILLMFIGPVLLNSAFKNSAHPLYYPVLVLALAVCIYACVLFFMGLKTVVKGIFND